MKERTLLFELIRCALWGSRLESHYTPDVFWSVLKIAEQQTVTGLVFDHIFDEGNFGQYSTKKHYSSRYMVRKWYSLVDQLCRQRELYGLFPKNALMSIKNPFDSIEQVVWEMKKGKESRNK